MIHCEVLESSTWDLARSPHEGSRLCSHGGVKRDLFADHEAQCLHGIYKNYLPLPVLPYYLHYRPYQCYNCSYCYLHLPALLLVLLHLLVLPLLPALLASNIACYLHYLPYTSHTFIFSYLITSISLLAYLPNHAILLFQHYTYLHYTCHSITFITFLTIMEPDLLRNPV